MEVLGVSSGIAGLISALGIIPTLIIISIAGFFFFREIKKALTIVEESVKARTTSLANQLSVLKEESDANDEKIMAILKEHEKEIRAIETTFLTREQHYRDFENWKSEMQELRAEVRNLPITILNMIKENSR
ncbi:MAG: hypothetical protein GX297_07545 [Treponema sp.]|jgi:nitrogen fixation/metabolism regulation signal transduction histidine kinase|nr:hypothetical protein [Treponema sp.]